MISVSLKLCSTDILPIATHEYPLPAKRPMNSRLDCSKLMSTFGISLPDWRNGVDYVFEQLHD
ncbi:hypothetical protein A8D95_10640 [Burkholderia cenocepacia]|uniref:sugar nucleotide-binding protein n=1 Tax=Burkholderia cenocepacia TaxID=95486 RepID=UPI00097C34EB|nr:sugar nucleotide-binding protein [Burkholderia cenocepacia]ONJ12948.1 hypothetical protein A8D83_07915 [Burkholderia cenocepacia]ONJ30952.1 hypothetical protein A8D90_11300 [Burkholderia cenocepacia]ONP22049.1 hypothetical protein A8D84_27795 [Burkholderia cenocepacia]ONP33979.1 hypothetical protein A8D85_26350 [Burkholderia cenocepacia]ONP35949.1 hypothetical protein A8D86_25505 [Burkholderia cenocepacia]